MRHFFPVLITILFLSCTRPPDYPIEPVIEFVSMSKNTMSQANRGTEEINVTISFTDGDGDIGFEQGSGDLDLFITDTRDASSEPPIKLVEVPPAGANNGISGEIYIKLKGTCCTYPPTVPDLPCQTATTAINRDTLIYEMYIKDRAGNKSNTITFEPIILTCD